MKRILVFFNFLLSLLFLICFSSGRVTPEQVQDIANKLNYIYGASIMVQIYPTPLGGMATGQGLVFIDPSFLENESYEAIFGVLAHEWAHEVLGHIPQVFLQQWMSGNNVFETNIFNQQKELEADYYAGRALKMYNLPLQPFLNLLIKYNVNADYTHPYLRSHPSTQERIQAATNGYNSL
ncbi:MAG: M48 family metalloprotease [bacterium]